MNQRIFTPEQFGAAADGITNDAAAFWEAIESGAKEGGVVALQPNKTYRIARRAKSGAAEISSSSALEGSDGGEKIAAIVLDGARNLTVRGDNTTLLIEAPLFHCNINNTENVTLEGLNFSYCKKPFAGAKTLRIDPEACTADVVTDRSLEIDADYDASHLPSYFGVLDRPDGRWHLYIRRYEVLSAQANQYRIHFNAKDEPTARRLALLETTRLVVPVPHIGHQVERGFSIVGNTNFTMRRCNIWAVARFGFALFRNEGTVRFEDVHFVPEPGGDLPISAWRDGYHVKENRAKFIWERCSAAGLYDDVFNISSSMLNVQKVYAPDDIDLFWYETRGVYMPLRPGDALTVIDVETGEEIGGSEVREVVLQEGSHNRIRLTRPLERIREGAQIKVCFDSMAAPGSEIRDCDFRGTMRFRGPIEIRDSFFYVARMWIDLCLPYEGPVPSGVHFTNCRFVCDDDEHVYFHVESQRGQDLSGRPYHLKDIRFERCSLNRANFQIGERDLEHVRFV